MQENNPEVVRHNIFESKAAPKLTVLEDLQRKLDPQYVGWQDQYKAILNALGIDPDQPLQGRCSGCGDNCTVYCGYCTSDDY